MKKLNIAATGYYGSTESWKWVASSYEMIAELLGKLIHRDDPVIITGVNVVGNNVSDGFISYAGELFFFKGGTKTDTVVIIENVTEQEYNTNPSGSGTMPTYPTYIDRYAKCGQSGEGVDEFLFDDFLRINEIADISELSKQATENKRGTLEIATQTETDDGTDDTKAITPAKLSGRTATEDRAGVIAIATQSETNTGTDDTSAVTPAKLAGRVASESMGGIIEIATQFETNEGIDDTRAVTPKKLASVLKIHASGTADLGTWSDVDYIRSKNVSIPELPDNNYIVQLTLFSDDLFSVNNHDTYFAFSRQKQNNSFTITVRRTDDGGSTSADPHIYVDWVVIKL